MNNYYLGFKYKGEVNVVVVTANHLANTLLGNTDDIISFKWNKQDRKKETQGFKDTIRINGIKYFIEIDDINPHCLMIAEYLKSDDDKEAECGNIIARNIPWICIKITDSDNNIIYNLCDEC